MKRSLNENKRELEALKWQIQNLGDPAGMFEPYLDYSMSMLKDLGTTWKRSDYKVKTALQKFAFPQGVFYSFPKFGTTQTAQLLSLNQAFSDNKMTQAKPESFMVTPRGIEPRF